MGKLNDSLSIEGRFTLEDVGGGSAPGGPWCFRARFLPCCALRSLVAALGQFLSLDLSEYSGAGLSGAASLFACWEDMGLQGDGRL